MADISPCPNCSAPATSGPGMPWMRQVAASIALTVPDLLIAHLLNHVLAW